MCVDLSLGVVCLCALHAPLLEGRHEAPRPPNLPLQCLQRCVGVSCSCVRAPHRPQQTWCNLPNKSHTKRTFCSKATSLQATKRRHTTASDQPAIARTKRGPPLGCSAGTPDACVQVCEWASVCTCVCVRVLECIVLGGVTAQNITKHHTAALSMEDSHHRH
jgi:hypothetical protein